MSDPDSKRDIDLLPGLPAERILACYANAPGKEIESGKFASPKSSAALAANASGYFLDRTNELPHLPGCGGLGWPAKHIELKVLLRFPWSGGRHPCLDAVAETATALIGRVEEVRTVPSKEGGKSFGRLLAACVGKLNARLRGDA